MKKNILDQLFKTPEIGSVDTSPNAKWVIWSWINLGPAQDLYLSPTDGSFPAKKITDFKQNTTFRSWTADNKHIIASHDYDGDERSRLYLINTETLETKPLTPEHPDYYIRGGQLHPDGKFLIYSANYNFKEKKETEISFLYKKNLKTNEQIILATPKKPNYVRVAMNDAGTHIFYTRSDIHPAGVQLWLVDIDGKENKEILNFGTTSKVSATWHKNSTDIYFISEEDTLKRVGVYNIKTKKTKWIIKDPKRNISWIRCPHGTNVIQLTETKEATYETSFIDPISFKETKLQKTHTIQPVTPISKDVWLCRYFNAQQPDTLILWNIKSGKTVKKITDIFKHVTYTQNDLVKAESYHWNSVDGLKIQGWLYKPKGKSKGTIVFVHGGPTHHSNNAFNTEIQYFVSRGFTVLDPNYRGSTGFSLKFQESIKKDHFGGKEQEDILEGIKSLIKDGIAEEFKIGITGTSYGGYSSWHAITHYKTNYISAAVPICGMTDLVIDYETTRPDCRMYSEEMMGGSPTEVPRLYIERSPIHFIQNIKSKLLIIQGAQDPNVTLKNVKVAEEKLKKYNIPYKTLIFKDEGHGIRRPKNQKILYKKMAKFFEDAFK